MGDKPKLLFLDDRSKRLHAALRKYGDEYDVTLVCTVKECIKMLSNERNWKVVSLDHDLCFEEFVDPDRKDCGMEVVRWLEKNKHFLLMRGKIPETFLIHSSNQSMGFIMKERLITAGYKAITDRFIYDD